MEPYIENPFQTNIPVLAAMHREADGIQSYMDIPIDLQDPASLTERLKYIDVYMARLTDLMIRAKAIKEREKNKFISDNEDKINKLTATVSNRMIDAHLYEYAVAYTRLDAMYHTLEHLSRDLVTQISYIKQQMSSFGG